MGGQAKPILRSPQIIMGMDMHMAVPPGFILPHPVLWGVGMTEWDSRGMKSENTSKLQSPLLKDAKDKVVRASSGWVAARAHDAGPDIPHLLPHILIPFILMASASKAEYASGSVLVGNGEVAVNDHDLTATMLHCQDFPVPPLPTGEAQNDGITVFAGYTDEDQMSGFNASQMDSCVGWAVGGIAGKLAGPFKGQLSNAAAAWAIGAFGIGGPLGYSSDISAFSRYQAEVGKINAEITKENEKRAERGEAPLPLRNTNVTDWAWNSGRKQ